MKLDRRHKWKTTGKGLDSIHTCIKCGRIEQLSELAKATYEANNDLMRRFVKLIYAPNPLLDALLRNKPTPTKAKDGEE